MERFNLTGKKLREDSEVAEGAISQFKNDVTGITTDSLEKLLAALSDEAFSYWISQVVEARGLKELQQSPIAIQTFVNQLDSVAAAEVLHSLAARLREDARLKSEQTLTAR